VILSTEKYPQDPKIMQIQEISNLVFYVIFLVEMFLKLAAVGIKEYFSDSFNSFDSFIIFVSTVDVVFSYTVSSESKEAAAITALRIFRLLRVFKLVKAWKKLNMLLNTIGKTVFNIAYFIMLLSIFILIYSLMGMNLFGF
jgi:hypothetical protein